MTDSAAKAVVTLREGEEKLEVVVRELTVAQMRQAMLQDPFPGAEASPEDNCYYQLDCTLFQDCRLCDLSLMTSLDKDAICGLTGGELRKILAKAKELNPDFFGALGRLARAKSEP